MKPKKRLPRFSTQAEEARFWDTHDLSEYDTQAIDETIEMDPGLLRRIRERARKKLLTIRLEAWRIEKAKRIARKQRIPYQALLRQWIAEGMKKHVS
jgi:predicted DNA binding CopG/RHH family protein